MSQTLRTTSLNEAIESLESESQQRADFKTSPYFVIHGGRASRASGPMHLDLHTLPGHIKHEAYIFTADRSDLIQLLH